MMKHYLVLLFVFVNPILGTCQKQINCNLPTPFHLIYTSGGVVALPNVIQIYKLNNKYYASNIKPLFSIGGKDDSVWTIELDSNKIFTCEKFINKAKKLPNECEQTINEYTHYEIAFQKVTINIWGDCEWEGLDFYNLRNILFKERFSELEQRITNFVDSITKQFKGKWYCCPSKKEHKDGDSLILSRTKKFDSDCLWEFESDGSFKSNCTDFLNLTHSKKFVLNVESIPTYLYIGNENMNKGIYDGIFILKLVNNKELKLSIKW